MVAGHLREKNGYYHMVLNYVDEYGKRHTPSKSTGLTVKGNKKRAEKMLSEARAAKEAELEARAIERSTGKAPAGTILFTAFLLDWLEMTKKNVEETTYGAYAMGIKNKIIPYFEEHHPQSCIAGCYTQAHTGLLHLRIDGARCFCKYGHTSSRQYPQSPTARFQTRPD